MNKIIYEVLRNAQKDYLDVIKELEERTDKSELETELYKSFKNKERTISNYIKYH